MDIKAKIDEITAKIKKDPSLKDQFMKDPEKALEKLIGIDIPDGMVDKVVAGIKAKLTGDAIGGAVDKIKNLF